MKFNVIDALASLDVEVCLWVNVGLVAQCFRLNCSVVVYLKKFGKLPALHLSPVDSWTRHDMAFHWLSLSNLLLCIICVHCTLKLGLKYCRCLCIGIERYGTVDTSNHWVVMTNCYCHSCSQCSLYFVSVFVGSIVFDWHIFMPDRLNVFHSCHPRLQRNQSHVTLA